MDKDDAHDSAPRESERRATVRNCVRPAVTTVERHAHLAAAAYLMRRATETAVVVTTDDESRRPVGVITETDIAQAVADRRDLNEVRIDELVGPEPVTTQPETAVNEATALMLAAGVRHLPVVENGHLVGIFDIADACRALLDAEPSWPKTSTVS
jgi:CBS domain-containing protein